MIRYRIAVYSASNLPACDALSMPDPVGAITPTALRRGISEQPNEPVLQSLGKNLITCCTDDLLSVSSPELRQAFTVQVAGTPKRYLTRRGS